MHLRLVLLVIAATLEVAPTQDSPWWPAFRGPNGTGCAATGDPPMAWSETENIKWKVALPGLGISSPIIWKDRIYVTTAVATDRPGKPAGELEPQSRLAQPRPNVVHEFRVLAIDRADGRVVWNRKVTETTPHEGGHSTNSHASNSPVTDGRHVYANFGSRGLYCLDLAGKVVWSKRLGVMRTRRQYGEASSPTLHGDRLIVNWDHEGDSFLVVLDKRNGEEIWRRPRDEVTSWSTPIVVDVDGRPQIIINATTATRGYDLATGKVVWSLGGMTVNTIPHPIHRDGTALVMSGYRGNTLQAIRLSGAQGDLDGKPNVLWTHSRNASYVPSAALVGDHLYFLRKNSGVLSCMDAKTGKIHYEGQRLRGLRSIYASPVSAAGRVYITSRDGVTRVIRHGSQFEEVATNRLDDNVDASLAIVGDEIYLRGHEHLYCIAKTSAKKKPPAPTPALALEIRLVAPFGSEDARTASVSIGDVDRDGTPELIAANGRHWAGQNLVYRMAGEGRLSQGRNLSEARSTSYAAALGDLDADGDLDVVVGNDRAPSYVLRNDGKGRFQRGPQVGTISNTRSVMLADLDGKHGLDVIFTNRREANRICFHDGKGGYARTNEFGGKADATIQVAAGDVDGDGDLDLAVANRNGQQNLVYLNDGKGSFGTQRPYGTGSDQTRGVAVADVDRDGHLDILNANIGEPNAIYFGDGTGRFPRSTKLGGKARSYAITTADLNGDGRIDVLVANVAGQNAAYVQNEDGRFDRVPFGPDGAATYGIATADLNGDGRPEIVTANSQGRNFVYRVAK